MSSSTKNQKSSKRSVAFLNLIGGLILLSGSVFSLLYLIGPFLLAEAKYNISKINPSQTSQNNKQPENILNPVNQEFSIVIPKINVSASIVKDVDPYNPVEYQKKLSLGIAHAKGTGLPGQGKNIFLFSHSSINFLEATRFNSVFYLLHHLNKNDLITVYFQNHKYNYLVQTSQIVSPQSVSFLQNNLPQETLTLMTCWPPGTSTSRLIVIAKPETKL